MQTLELGNTSGWARQQYHVLKQYHIRLQQYPPECKRLISGADSVGGLVGSYLWDFNTHQFVQRTRDGDELSQNGPRNSPDTRELGQ